MVSLNYTLVFLFIEVYLSFFLSITLFLLPSPRKQSNRLLGLFFLFAGFQILFHLIKFIYVNEFVFLDFYITLIAFNYAPLIYLYTQSLIFADFKIDRLTSLHFIPFFLFLFLHLTLNYSFNFLGEFLLYSITLVYSFLAILRIWKFRSIIRNTSSTNQIVDLFWLEAINIYFILAIIIDIISSTITDLVIFDQIQISQLIFFLMINWVYYKSISFPYFFKGVKRIDSKFFSYELFEIVKKKTELLDINIEDDAVTISNFIVETEAFTNPELTLEELASSLGFKERRLSYVINYHFKVNFVAFINDFRINKAIERFNKPNDPNETIAEVMYDVGFNSRSSFNAVFKQKTGLTPREYKRSITSL